MQTGNAGAPPVTLGRLQSQQRVGYCNLGMQCGNAFRLMRLMVGIEQRRITDAGPRPQLHASRSQPHRGT